MGTMQRQNTTAEIAGSLRFLSFDPDLNVAFRTAGWPARTRRKFIMMPDIGLTLWYEASALTDDARADRDPMPRGIFRLAHCLDAPHPLAGPGKVGLEFPDGDGDDEAAGAMTRLVSLAFLMAAATLVPAAADWSCADAIHASATCPWAGPGSRGLCCPPCCGEMVKRRVITRAAQSGRWNRRHPCHPPPPKGRDARRGRSVDRHRL